MKVIYIGNKIKSYEPSIGEFGPRKHFTINNVYDVSITNSIYNTLIGDNGQYLNVPNDFPNGFSDFILLDEFRAEQINKIL